MNQQNQEQNERRNFLIEFEKNGYELIQFKEYEDFLFECNFKNYDGIGTQKHHILPSFMNGTIDSKNMITLSYQDHYQAHMILAMCFPKGHIDRGKNYASAKLIVGNAKQHLQKRYGSEFNEHWEGFWETVHKEICELNRGENHPQFGDKLSAERRNEMSKQRKGKRVGSENPFYGKKHTEETKRIIREKRAVQIFPEDVNIKRSEALKGERNHFYGKHHTEESKEKIRIKRKTQVLSNKSRKQISETMKRIWEERRQKKLDENDETQKSIN